MSCRLYPAIECVLSKLHLSEMLQGPSLGAVGTVMGRELPRTPRRSTIWRVEFDDFPEQFYAAILPGIWFVHSDEIELLARE